mgnify:CR=1 FL=1
MSALEHAAFTEHGFQFVLNGADDGDDDIDPPCQICAILGALRSFK